MPFDWSQFLALAKDLAQRKDNEAALRSAVSRAYYAAFCMARDRARERGKRIEIVNGASHRPIWDIYDAADDMYCRKIAATGSRLLRKRVQADYDARVLRWQSEADSCIRETELLLDFLGHLREDRP